jgi:Family of unknown function (DUF6338)
VPQGLQTLVALLLLLPGFLSARIAGSLSAQGQRSDLERVIEALIFSFVTYVIYIALFGTGLHLFRYIVGESFFSRFWLVRLA